MYKWMDKTGKRLKDSAWVDEEKSPYLGHLTQQPFPLNPFFRSERVLSEEMRQLLVEEVREKKKPIKVVSIEQGVDARRIAAVLRMKDIERQWKQEGKQLATPYAKAMLRILPVHRPGNLDFEPVNEMHVHKLTQQQLYVPVAESREFTREDAAKAFHRKMLSPDERTPHPELIQLAKDRDAGVDKKQSWKTLFDKAKAVEDALNAKVKAKRDEEERRTSRVDSGRFEFRFKDVNVDLAGSSGRGRGYVGMRYGVPFNDRKKGAVKIPTSMP